MGRLHAKVQPLTLLSIIKLRASILKWHPFLISSSKHCIPFIMDNLFIMNQSVSCEVCVFELQQWNASIGLIKVLLKSKLKMCTKHGVPVHGQPPVDHPRVVRKFWSRRLICQSKQPALGRRHCQAPKAQASWGGLGACSPGKFLRLDALKCCFLHSPGYFLHNY